jgi:hypothetical protein
MKDAEINKYREYSEDPIKFIKENRLGFNSKTKKFENLEMMDFEEVFLRHIHDNKLSVTKKSRQMHMTSLSAAYCAWKLIFKAEKSIAIICPKKDQSIRFIELVRIILQNYSNNSFHWEDDFVKDNKSEIRLVNGSFIKAIAPSFTALRGYRFDTVIMDEVAFIKQAEEIWTAIVPFLLHDSQIIFYSSTNGINFFHKVWAQTVKEESNFAPLSFDYTDNPHYNNKEWYENMCRILNNDKNAIDSELHGLFVEHKAPESYRLNLRVESDIFKAMNSKIKKEGTNVSDYIRDLIKKDLDI